MVGFLQVVSVGLGLWLTQRAIYVYKAIRVGCNILRLFDKLTPDKTRIYAGFQSTFPW